MFVKKLLGNQNSTPALHQSSDHIDEIILYSLLHFTRPF